MFRLSGLVSVVALAAVLAGCGANPIAPTAARSAGATIVHEDFNLKGQFKVVFKGLAAGYRTMAVRGDVARVRISLSSPRLLAPIVREVYAIELERPEVVVFFDGVPEGEIKVTIQAIDRTNVIIGTKESTAAVKPNATTQLQLDVHLDANTGKGSLATNISFVDAIAPTPAASATLSPEASAAPSAVASGAIAPAPSASPGTALDAAMIAGPSAPAQPAPLVTQRLLQPIFHRPEAVVTVKNPGDRAIKLKVQAYFLVFGVSHAVAVDAVALEPGEAQTLHLKGETFWWIDSLKVVLTPMN